MMESERGSEAVVSPFSDFCSRLVLQVFIVVVLAISSSYALYEDQIGKFDWRQEYIGKVRLGSVEPRSGPSKILYVATDQNVIAALDIRTGSLIWRAVMEDPLLELDAGVNDLVTSGRSVAAVSSAAKILRVWDARTGVLKWDARLQEKDCPSGSVALSRSGAAVMVLRCDILSSFSLSDGTLHWETDIGLSTSTRQMSWSRMVVDAKSEDVSVFGGEEGVSVAVAAIDSTNGRLRASDTKPAPWFHSKRCELVVSSMLCLDPEGKSEVVRAEGGRAELSPGPSGVHLRVWALDKGYFGLSVDGRLSIYELGVADPVLSVDVTPVDLRLLALDEKDLILGVLSGGGLDTHWYSLPSGKLLSKTQSPSGTSRAPAELLFPSATTKGGEVVPKAVLSGADGVLTVPGFWRRHEAMSRILALEMIDLPLSEAQANIEKEFATDSPEGLLGQMRQRLGMQYEQIGRSMKDAVSDIINFAHESPAAPLLQMHGSGLRSSGGRSKLERDAFNLHKMIVVTTESGKVYGLDSRDGSVEWELWPERLGPLRSATGETEIPLLVLRSTAHYPHPAQAVLIGADKGLLVFLDPISGRLVSEERLDWPIRHFMSLPYSNHDALAAFMLVGPNNEVVVRPSGVDLPSRPPVYFMSVEAESGHLSGLQLRRSGKTFSASTIWTARLPISDAQKIVRVVPKRFAERMHSPGRALGDRSVLYKYANPNLVAIMALSPDSQGGGGQLSVFLVDGVTGEVLHAMEHSRALKPLHLLHCENWLVYSFWNEKGRRTEVATLELYEGKTQVDPDTFSSLSPANQKPLILPQSYIFQQGITALGVTDTEKGMTNRHLLIAMPFGGILEMPKGLLDPRRGLVLTQENREEGLIPYIPELPIATEHILNYNQSIMRTKAVETRPGGLESTTLLFARGLDVYFTRLTPSGTFDVLKDDFDHWVIAAVLIALTVATFVSKRLARNKDLQQNWK